MFLRKLFKRIIHWESWPFELLYAPLTPVWIWYMLRSGSVWFFTPSNPRITFGGLEGEPKKEMYDLLPDHLYPATIYADPALNADDVLGIASAAGIHFPFIVKPEVGWQGIMLRKIDNGDQFSQYHRLMQDVYIVQQLVEYPVEVSVFYVRHPNEPKGKVTGFLQKVPLHVTGNGKESLAALVQQHPKAASRAEELEKRHRENWMRIIPENERYFLSYAANHNRGARFIDLRHLIDDQLLSHFDALSHRLNDFFYGRYDIMCQSPEDLRQGRNFLILEYNGCGAEPNHFYDTGYSLLGAYREILNHWNALYRISAHNSKAGIKPWPFMKGMKFLIRSRRITKKLKQLDEMLEW